jgi:ABC-type branched-subunit amino acid transport system substrate-binding protein
MDSPNSTIEAAPAHGRRRRRAAGRGVIAMIAVLAIVGAACSSSSDSGSSTKSTTSSTDANAEFVSLGGWNDGACDSSKPAVKVSLIAPIEAPGTSLGGYADGAQAAVTAFNQRGGAKGGCMDVSVCDSKGDGPTELACARAETDDSSVVAGLASTFTSVESDAYQLFESAGLAQVGAQVTLPSSWNSPVSFEFTMGGSGTLLAGVPALDNVGVKTFDIFVPQSGQSGGIRTFAQPMIDKLGMTLVNIIEIPPTAVEFTQFVQTAENDGAQGIVLGLPEATATQILDAMDSLNSTLKVSAAWGSFSQQAVASLPDTIAANMAFNDAVPPLATDLSRWPIYNVVLADFAASGKSSLTQDNSTVQSVNGWMSVYALAKVMRDSTATEVTRASVLQAFNAATNVPMFDVVPPWTPSKQSTNQIFKGISNPYYWVGTWDGSTKQFVVADKQVDILALLS